MAASKPQIATDPPAVATQASCLRCMEAYQSALASSALAPRLKAKLWDRLLVLLHYLVACRGKSIEDADHDDIAAFLAPAIGLHEHDLRCQMLDLVASCQDLPKLRSWHQSGWAGWRHWAEFLFWSRHHRNVHRRSSAFFAGISQADVQADEFHAIPFYQAMWQALREIGDEALDTDEEVLRHLKALQPALHQPLQILDIGCGRGRLLQRVAKDYPQAKLTGTELVAWYHPQLRQRGIEPIQCDAGQLEIADASQDIVISTDVIEHLRHPARMVREIARVLKPGGVYCVGAPSSNAHFYSRNPLAVLRIALSDLVPPLLPPFHNLYAPLTPLKIVHYGFSRQQMQQLFAPTFAGVTVQMKRFYPLRRLGLDRVAPHLPLLRGMGLYCMAFGRK